MTEQPENQDNSTNPGSKHKYRLKHGLYGEWTDLSSHCDYIRFQDRFVVLQKTYTSFVPISRDGNCFYTSFIFQLCRLLSSNTKKFILDIRQRVSIFPEKFSKIESAPYAYESFQQEFYNLLDAASEIVSRNCYLRENGKQLLTADANFPDFSDKYRAITVFLKLLASMTIQFDSHIYGPFIDMDLKEYCRKNVEVLYKMTSHVDICALSRALNVGVKIESLISNDAIHIGNTQEYVCILHSPSHFEPLL